MDRDRQEPTFSKPDAADLQFRSDRTRAPSIQQAGPPWAYIVGGIVVAVIIAMGLIEWNAKRQAAAITAELTRPMTKKEQAQFDAEMAKLERESAAQIAELRRHIDRPVQLQTPRYAPPDPLRPGQRCMSGKRFERIEGGWKDLPNKPC